MLQVDDYEVYSTAWNAQLKGASLDFLPPELKNISSTLYDDENFAQLDFISGTDVASLLTRSIIDARAASHDHDISSTDLISRLCSQLGEPQRAILIGPAGYGKTTLLKQITLTINSAAVLTPHSNPCIAVYVHVNTFISKFQPNQSSLSVQCILQLVAETLRAWHDPKWRPALERLLISQTPLVCAVS